MRTLSIDCGGSGIKGAVLDQHGSMITSRHRIATTYPLTPARFVATLSEIAAEAGRFDRATVGMPGIIRHGRVITTPHYITVAGPHSPIDPQLAQQWLGWQIQDSLTDLWQVPVLVLNDAQIQGAAVIQGVGLEVMFTLGTGLGCAIFDDGAIVPKLEISRAPVRKGVIYDEWVGAAARKRVGDRKWSKRVHQTLEGLRPMFAWDRVYLGGGDAKKVLGELPSDVNLVDNLMGIQGGVRVWDLANLQLS